MPIALFSGKNDSVVRPENNRELNAMFGNLETNPVVEFRELQADHMSFLLGKNMTYFQEILRLCNNYNKLDQERRRQEIEKERKVKKTRYQRIQDELTFVSE